MMLIPLCRGYWELLAVNLVIGVAIGMYMPPLMAMAVDVGRQAGMMNRVMSLLEMAFSFGMVIGPLSAGIIKGYVGLPAVFLSGGVLGIITCVIFMISVVRDRRRGFPV